MKSERRHELQQNDLASYLGRIKEATDPYLRVVAVVVGVVIVGAIGIGIYNSEQRGQRSDATLQLIQAAGSQDAEVLLTVSENYPETAAGAWARLYQGKQYLSQGIQALYSSRENAEELLGDAQAAFKSAIAGSNDRLLRSRAYYGIARAAESLGNLDEAIEAYREVVTVNESEAMVKKAQERIEILSNPPAKEFLVWFSDQNFAPADPSMPPALPGGDTLPDLPDIDLPDLSLSSDEDSMELKEIEGGLEMPEKKPAAETTTDSAKKADSSEKTDAAQEKADSADAPSADVDSGQSQDTPGDNKPTTEDAEKPKPADPDEPAPDDSGSADPSDP